MVPANIWVEITAPHDTLANFRTLIRDLAHHQWPFTQAPGGEGIFYAVPVNTTFQQFCQMADNLDQLLGRLEVVNRIPAYRS